MEHRGITNETLEAFGVTFDNNSVIFPYPTGEKTRSFDLETGKRFFKFTGGKNLSLFQPKHLKKDAVAFICEGETDTMKLWQEINEEGGKADVFGISGVNGWRTDFATYFSNYRTVYIILDNESAYENPIAYEQVEKCAHDIRQDLGNVKGRRLRLPEGVKDVCEFFESGYNMKSMRLLVQKGKTTSRFNPLDLRKDPPPTDWLFEGIIAKGDVTLVSGVSNLGKSWITMGAATAITERHETFLGCKVFPHNGKVLYVDEENPQDVVYSRLKRLGLSSFDNLRYLWNNGIRLDRNADLLLEEALDYEPDLIILDSLTRIHGKEENSVGDMAPLLNDCIKPLARDTGAAVVLIHHHDKSANGPRGSSDILNSVDGALDAHSTNVPGQFSLKLSKSRRRLTGDDIWVKITDMPDGTVRLVTIDTLEAPF